MSETDTTRFDLSLDFEATEPQTINVQIGGRVIAFPVMEEWPVEAQQMLMEGRFRDLLDQLLADRPEDLDAFDGATIKQMRKLLEHLAELTGVNQGEARGSANSSRSTRRKSKQTS